MKTSIPHPLTSLTIVLPFFNDAGTVRHMIADAYRVGSSLAKELQVVAIHGGLSGDDTAAQIHAAQIAHPHLCVLDESHSAKGYAVIATGLKNARTEWVFYTDGDGQYSLDDLSKLVAAQLSTKADVINGYKGNRQDSVLRVVAGALYAQIVKRILKLPLRDPHCDFRLIKTALLANWKPRASGAAFIQDLIVHLKHQTMLWAEVEVSHYSRIYGHSNYSALQLCKETVSGMLTFWRYR